jgi:hypothetical protein
MNGVSELGAASIAEANISAMNYFSYDFLDVSKILSSLTIYSTPYMTESVSDLDFLVARQLKDIDAN